MSDTIQVTKLRDEAGEASLKVEIPADLVAAAENKAAATYAKRAKLPGFRKGKVPLQIVKKKFLEGIRGAALQRLIDDSWKVAVKQENLKPLSDPRVKDLKFEAGAPVTFELRVEVKPEITLDRTSGFEIKRHINTITDEMINGQLAKIREQKAPWSPLEGEKAAPGDLVRLLLLVKEAGAEDYPDGKPVQFILGGGQAIPDVEDRIMTMDVGEILDTTVKFPDDFPDETKRSQSRAVRIELQEAKRQQLPELTDDFAREVGDFETVDDLKRVIREDLESEAEREADASVRKELMTQIVVANNIVAPAPLVRRMIKAFGEAYEIKEDRFEDFAKEFLPVAENQVKRDLVLDHLEEREGLGATEEEIDQKIEEIAESRKEDRGHVYASLQKANRLRDLERGITERKIFEFLKSRNTITDG